MHIVFLSDNFPPETNAAATRVYERAIYWVKWGFQVTVITSVPNSPQGKVYPPYRNQWYQVENMDGIRVIRVKTFIAPNTGFFLRVIDFVSYMISSFFAGLREKKPDLIVSTSPQFFCALGGWFLSWVRRKPFVFELADLWPDSIMAVTGMKKNIGIRIIEKIELFLYRQSAAVIALTAAFKKNLTERGISPDKIHVVRNGVDLSRYQPQNKNINLLNQYGLENKFIVGYLGTHGMAHALTRILDAALLLKERYPQIIFFFLGDGAERISLMEKAEALQLSNIIFIPAQPKNKMPDFLSLCDISLVHLKNSPVFETVIPSKIFEAMGMGLPIVFSGPAGEASQIIEENQAGVCVPPENPQKLAEAIAHLYENPSHLHALAENSKNAASSYQREHQAREMINVLKLVALH